MIQKLYNDLSDKGKVICNVAMVVAALAIADRLFLGPTLDDLQQIGDEIARQRISVRNDLKFLQHEDEILNDQEEYSKYFSSEVGDEDVVNADFLSAIEQLASKSSVNLVKSNPSQSKSYKGHVEYYANLDCSGTLENLITFMHAVNSTDELLKVVKFNMTPKRGAENEVNASMTVVKLLVKS